MAEIYEDGAFVADEEILASMMALGISKTKAEEALFVTGNNSLDAAVSFVMSNEMEGASDTSSDEETTNYKMVFVVNNSLGMSVGKLAAQVAHACLSLYRSMRDNRGMNGILMKWASEGEKKVVLQGENHLHLNQLFEKAVLKGIACRLIHDAGRTEIPKDSVTVLCLFGTEDDVNMISGDLQLLH